jgi:tetratricopeptide (TPR) repeat protein
MKKIAALFWCSCIAGGICAQEQMQRDSLRKQLGTAAEDTVRVKLFYQLGESYILENPDSAITLVLQGLSLSRSIGNRKYEMSGLTAMGNLFSLKGNFPEALRSHLQALEIAEEENYKTWIAEISMNMASVYFYQKDFAQSLSYMRRVKEIGEQIHSKEYVQNAAENMGAVYVVSEQYDSALMYTQQAFSQAVELGKTTYNLLLNLGHIYSGRGQSSLALEHFRSALPEIEKEGNDYYKWEAYLGMAKVFEQTGQMDSALYYGRSSFEITRKTGYLQGCLDAATYLTSLYKEKKNSDSAFYYSEQAKAANDSLFSQQKLNQLQSLTLAEKIRQKEKEEQDRIAREERKHNLQYAAIAIGLIAFLLLFLLLSHSIIVNKNVIRFLAALSLLIIFEFINLLIHPFLVHITHHSPVLILTAMVSIAAFLIPIHHKHEHWMTQRLVEKNNRIRLAAAKKTIAELEGTPAT